jgi:DNA invertase Pin-like site-specific DNA recombinase
MADLLAYARTSTDHQDYGLQDQIEKLIAAGVDADNIYSEQVSSVAQRDGLEDLLKHLRKGDTLVVCKLDRLARSMRDLLRIVDVISGRKAFLKVLGTSIDTSTPDGRLMLNVLGSFAEFERDIMLVRQKAGIERAKAEGKFKGRKPTARAKSEQILALRERGIAASEIAHRLEISPASVYRVLEDSRAVEGVAA